MIPIAYRGSAGLGNRIREAVANSDESRKGPSKASVINGGDNRFSGSVSPLVHLRVVHLHIPRTGGSSLDAHLTAALAETDIEFTSGHLNFDECLSRNAESRQTIIFVAFRDPVERVVSYYNYVRGRTDHLKFEAFSNYPLIELLDWPNALHTQLCNGQTRQICGSHSDPRPIGVSDLSEAFHRLSDRNVIVATTDDLSAGLRLLSERIGVPIQPLRTKTNESRGSVADSLTALRIQVRNFVDWRLYRMAQAGIFS